LIKKGELEMSMKYFNEFGAWVIGLSGSIYSFITGNTERAFQILLLFMVVDIVSGVLKGIQKRKLKSAIMNLGIMKKAGIILAVIFAMLLDNLINNGNVVFATMMTWLAIGNESLSILENLIALGVKIPKAITSKINAIVSETEDLEKEKDE
jgi:toxin secretion/phage lysis holin